MMESRLSVDLNIGRLFWIICMGPVYLQGSLKVKQKGDWSDNNVKRTPLTIAGFEDRRKPQVKDNGQPVEGGEGKKTDSPPEALQKGIEPSTHLDLDPVRLVLDLPLTEL